MLCQQPPQSCPPARCLPPPTLRRLPVRMSPRFSCVHFDSPVFLCFRFDSAGRERVVRRKQGPHPLHMGGQRRVCHSVRFGLERLGRVLAGAAAAAPVAAVVAFAALPSGCGATTAAALAATLRLHGQGLPEDGGRSL